MLQTPVLFLIFNRPDTTMLVFESIRQAKPKVLFIAADGARHDKPGEMDKCEACRTVVDLIDWPCEVKTLFRDKNLGCKIAVSSAINWFFDQNELGIILEDDCLPDPTFFQFCEVALEKYRYDNRVMHISGTNFLFNGVKHNYSYYFSQYVSIWGWASWARAWKLYDPDLKLWPLYKQENLLANVLNDQTEVSYFSGIFDELHLQKFDTWDLQWFYTLFFNRGASISPAMNLVSNIGFGPDATHTHNVSKCANLATVPVNTITHPPFLVIDKKADEINFNISFNGHELRKQRNLKNQIKSFYIHSKHKLKLMLYGAKVL